MVLMSLYRSGQLLLIAALLVAAFFFLYPEFVPHMVADAINPATVWFESRLGAGTGELLWLTAAGILTLAALPLLAILEFAVRLSSSNISVSGSTSSARNNPFPSKPVLSDVAEEVPPAHASTTSIGRPRRTVLECLR